MKRGGAVVVFLALTLVSAGPGEAATFREVASVKIDERLMSDGVRFAAIERRSGELDFFSGDTGRRLRLRPPREACPDPPQGFRRWAVRFASGLVTWTCLQECKVMLTHLSTGISRTVPDIAALSELEGGCPWAATPGLQWLALAFGSGSCCIYERWLNHRTGELRNPYRRRGVSPLIDLDVPRLVRKVCSPLPPRRVYSDGYDPPLAIGRVVERFEAADLLVRRCGVRRKRVISRCRPRDCVTPQLASGYVTWAQGSRVFGWFPGMGRRQIAPTPREFGDYGFPATAVAHTCDRVFGTWQDKLYVARIRRADRSRCHYR